MYCRNIVDPSECLYVATVGEPGSCRRSHVRYAALLYASRRSLPAASTELLQALSGPCRPRLFFSRQVAPTTLPVKLCCYPGPLRRHLHL